MDSFKIHLKRMFAEFLLEMKNESWYGQERTLVSRFAFSKLIENVGCCEGFFSAAQIGIEVQVEQVLRNEKNKRKEKVCKDLVIWNKPNQTYWQKDNIPLCIVEWKHGKLKPSKEDVLWLKEFTGKYKNCFGVALALRNKDKYEIDAILIEKGKIADKNWLNLSFD